MIKELQLRNFKCFQQSPVFEFSKINLLTGINGRGKSSLLQAILVLSQSSRRFNDLNVLTLNGRHVSLGSFVDIKNSDTTREGNISFKVKLLNPALEANLAYKEDERDQFTAVLAEKNIEILENDDIKQLQTQLQEFKKSLGTEAEKVTIDAADMVLVEMFLRIHYVGADRLGPVKYVDKVSLPDFLTVGPRGEYAINILGSDNLPLVHESLYRGNDARTVIQQTEEWLSYILDGASLKIAGKDDESMVLSMLLNSKKNSYKYKSSNVGFGYSYILPVIVSGLIAGTGEILIIENPEAHLHPRAQSKVTEFLAKVAARGVQVFIESHSEHILNGLRVSALDPMINLSHNELTIQYFTESFEPQKLVMSETGKIGNWPDGFFDQQEIDLSHIFRLSKTQVKE